MEGRNVLVIKLSAFGDFVQAIPAFQAIRAHHHDVRLVLMTTPAFTDFAEKLRVFDEILIHRRHKMYDFSASWRLRKTLQSYDFAAVYDLQCVTRTAMYFHLLRPSPPRWAGIAKGARIYYPQDFLEKLRPMQRHHLLLEGMGVLYHHSFDNSWVKKLPTPDFPLPRPPYALIAFGAAAARPEKCWPYRHYADIARLFAKKGITPVLIGAAAEQISAKKIQKICPDAINLVGKTKLHDIAILGQKAELALGNDTGAMHLLGQMGSPLLVLFSGRNDPQLCKPAGNCEFMQVQNLQSGVLSVKTVAKKLGLH